MPIKELISRKAWEAGEIAYEGSQVKDFARSISCYFTAKSHVAPTPGQKQQVGRYPSMGLPHFINIERLLDICPTAPHWPPRVVCFSGNRSVRDTQLATTHPWADKTNSNSIRNGGSNASEKTRGWGSGEMDMRPSLIWLGGYPFILFLFFGTERGDRWRPPPFPSSFGGLPPLSFFF